MAGEYTNHHENPISKKPKLNDEDDEDHSEEEEDNESELSVDSFGFFTYNGYTSNNESDGSDPQQSQITSQEIISSTGSFSKLPTEILYKILSLLPIKTLSNCRFVSKSFYSAITDPNFIQIHHKKVIQNKLFSLIYNDLSHPGEFTFINHENLESFDTKIVAYEPKLPRPLVGMSSCNGLVCSRKQPYFICNPVTGEHRVIPKPEMYEVEDVVVGFGFDQVNQVFKFVRVIKVTENSGTIAQLYNFSTGKWKLIHDVPYVFEDVNVNVCVNGALHWLGCKVDKSVDSKIIISFRFDSEEFREVPLPIPTSDPDNFRSIYQRRRFSQYLVALGDFLCVVCEFQNEEIEIWKMKEYGLQSSWVKEYSIQDVIGGLDIYTEGELERGPYKPLQLMKNGKILMLCSHHDLGYYDPFDGTLESIYTGTGDYADSVLQPLLHIVSLISPNSIGILAKSKRLDVNEEVDGNDIDEEGTEFSDDEVTEFDDDVDSEDYLYYDGYTSNEYDIDATGTELREDEESDVSEMSGFFSKLPVEVFFEILSRLPLKSLSSCRWVNKGWFGAIKNPRFIQMYHDKVIQNKSFCVLSYDSYDGAYSLFANDNLEAFETHAVCYTPKLPRPLLEMDSCNGLVCSRQQPYFVCNPITGEHMVIPKPPLYGKEDIVTGFGFDPVTKVFKFLRIIEDAENHSSSATIAQLYNFSTGKWRLILEVPFVLKNTKSNVFVDGALHWLGYPIDKSMNSKIIISFRFDLEQFQQVPMPIPTSPSDLNCFSFRRTPRRFDQYLVVLGEFLCIVREFRTEEIEVWIMKEYGVQSSWVKEYSIEDISGSFDICIDGELENGPYMPLQIMKNGKLLMLCSRHNLGYYDPFEKRFEHIYSESGTYADSVLHPVIHGGSLISPRSIGKLRKSKRISGKT